MQTLIQSQQAADIRAAASILEANFSRREFESNAKHGSSDKTAGNPYSWKTSPVNNFCRAVLLANGYGHLDVSTYAGVTVIGVLDGATESFDTYQRGEAQECRVNGWEQYQQVVNPDWAHYVGLYAMNWTKKIAGKSHGRTISKEYLLSILEVFDIDTLPISADGSTATDWARKWVGLLRPMSLFIE